MSRVRWVTALAAVAALLVAGPALAKNPYPPPSHGSATVVPSRIKAGECAVFSGDGFFPFATVAIADNGASAGTAPADGGGRFSKRLCYGADAKRGRHVLTGTGEAADGSTQTVSAVLTVEGVRQSASSSSFTSTGLQASLTSAAAVTSSTGGTTGGVAAPPPVGTGSGSQVPAAGANSGSRLLEYGLAGLSFAFLASLLILLLDRRRRRDEEPAVAPA